MGKSDFGKLVSVAGAATAIGGAYKFGEFMYKAKRLKDVGPANAVYVRLIGRVSADLDEVRRLLTVPEVHDALAANPPKSKWVYGAVRDVRGALENITPHTERVAGDIEDGRRVGLRHRVYWLLSEQEKLANREKELTTAHASLTEVIGYLTALEPVDEQPKKHKEKHDKHESRNTNTKIDIDVRHGGPERRIDEREIYIEKHEHGPRRVEERDVWVEHERGPRRVVEERETYTEHERGPRRVVDEREVYIDERGTRRVDERETYYDERGRPRRYEEHEYIEHRDGNDGRYARGHHDHHAERIDERELHIERDPRDPRHVEAQYYERGPDHYTEKRYEERRIDPGLGRRPESFEDRVPERESWMQSEARRSPYGQYAEYGAPQPIGAAEYRLPPMQTDHRREVWIEEKEDYRYDEYGNKLPDPIQGTRYPQYPPRSRI
ncbi:hypothetical protein B0J11DRAFT_533187 [Dendryphion nanum]|uniref:Uncharacterized protein n=1 Tax=Dendryphion nanum TaxID=256645 RepID=A0A9P9DL88_9PLEO|nr:hypothetical protein B0J11DRAFT_533187 [Dendryphion nanum]